MPKNWRRLAATWSIRITHGAFLAIAGTIVFGGADGWEKDFTPALNPMEEKRVRAGVVFEHAFQLGFWTLGLLVSELGNVRTRTVVLAVETASMVLIGLYGLPTWLAGIGYKEDVLSTGWTASAVMVALLGGGFVASITDSDGDKEKDA